MNDEASDALLTPKRLKEPLPLEEKQKLVHACMQTALEAIAQASGEAPTAMGIVVQFPRVEECVAGFVMPKGEPSKMAKTLELIGLRLSREITKMRQQLAPKKPVKGKRH